MGPRGNYTCLFGCAFKCYLTDMTVPARGNQAIGTPISRAHAREEYHATPAHESHASLARPLQPKFGV